ncbi:MAG: transglutaminase domain-containing protein, partial [archaeon]|nr:transglutaminase domain-containing protein [archaeon]
MKRLAILLLILFLATSASAVEFRPSTVKSMELTMASEVSGTIGGTITKGDEAQIFFLTIQPENRQQIISIKEQMTIAGDVIEPEYVKQNNLTYASYTIDLYKYSEAREFTIVREARVKRNATIGLNADYNLSQPIESYRDLLEPTDYIESDDQEIQAKASVEFTSDSEIETIREIAQWVNNNIEYDFENYYNGIWGAKDTYNSRAGVCDEFANLTAAFSRAKGIPTRYVSGMSFDGERFGLHGWLEMYLPGSGWIGVDSTYGEAGYIDAAHISIAKTQDANQAIDFIAKTTSVKPITISAELGLPEVEIHSVEFFEGMLEKKVEKPEAVRAGEPFQAKAELTNVSGSDIMVPIELVLHPDFEVSNPQRIVYIRAGETKNIEWDARAPINDFSSGHYDYGMLLLSLDGNVSANIRMVPKILPKETNASISAIDVSPFVSQKGIEIKILLENSGGKSGTAKIEIFYEENLVETREERLLAYEKKEITITVPKIEYGEIDLAVLGE